MPTIEMPKVYREVDLRAAAEAAAALHEAAAGMAILTAADEVLRGSEESARERLRQSILSPGFAPQLGRWMRELRDAASAFPDSGACTVATAMKLWSWTVECFRADGGQPIDDLAAALAPLLAARCFVLDAIIEPTDLRLDLSHVYAAYASSQTGAVCAELVFGYRRHLKWDVEGCATCYVSDDLDDLESLFPGFASGARTSIDIIERDGSHPAKRGPCVRFDGMETFLRLRNRLDGCLTGSRLARDRAAGSIGGRAR